MFYSWPTPGNFEQSEMETRMLLLSRAFCWSTHKPSLRSVRVELSITSGLGPYSKLTFKSLSTYTDFKSYWTLSKMHVNLCKYNTAYEYYGCVMWTLYYNNYSWYISIRIQLSFLLLSYMILQYRESIMLVKTFDFDICVPLYRYRPSFSFGVP